MFKEEQLVLMSRSLGPDEENMYAHKEMHYQNGLEVHFTWSHYYYFKAYLQLYFDVNKFPAELLV